MSEELKAENGGSTSLGRRPSLRSEADSKKKRGGGLETWNFVFNFFFLTRNSLKRTCQDSVVGSGYECQMDEEEQNGPHI